MSFISIEEKAQFSPDLQKEAEEYAEHKRKEWGENVEVVYSYSCINVITKIHRRFVNEMG